MVTADRLDAIKQVSREANARAGRLHEQALEAAERAERLGVGAYHLLAPDSESVGARGISAERLEHIKRRAREALVRARELRELLDAGEGSR